MTANSVYSLISPNSSDFDQVYAKFRWRVPSHFNIAESVCDRHRNLAGKIALFYENERGDTARTTFGQLRKASNQLANALLGPGIKQGDRVAIVLPQRLETSLAHLASAMASQYLRVPPR